MAINKISILGANAAADVKRKHGPSAVELDKPFKPVKAELVEDRFIPTRRDNLPLSDVTYRRHFKRKPAVEPVPVKPQPELVAEEVKGKGAPAVSVKPIKGISVEPPTPIGPPVTAPVEEGSVKDVSSDLLPGLTRKEAVID